MVPVIRLMGLHTHRPVVTVHTQDMGLLLGMPAMVSKRTTVRGPIRLQDCTVSSERAENTCPRVQDR